VTLSATFLLSATDVSHFPDYAKTQGAPEIAFLGRSNVGKSSVINALLGSHQAHTSSTPGRTRAINFFTLHEGSEAKRKTKAKGRGRFKGAGALGIELTSIGGVRVSSSEYEKEEKGRGKRTGALVGGGAGLGAIIGGLAGGGKGAVIGGLAGAGAGTAGAGYTGNHDVTIPTESLITFRLLKPVSR